MNLVFDTWLRVMLTLLVVGGTLAVLMSRSMFHIQRIGTLAGLQVWLVRGPLVRGLLDPRFGPVAVGDFVPAGELWLDRMTQPTEAALALLEAVAGPEAVRWAEGRHERPTTLTAALAAANMWARRFV